MKRETNRIDGRQMANTIKYLHSATREGMTITKAAYRVGVPRTTASAWLREYNAYLQGSGHYTRIARAVPFLVVDEAKVRFQEQHGRLPEQRPYKREEVKPKRITLWRRIMNWLRS